MAFSASTFSDIDFKAKLYQQVNTAIMAAKDFLENYIATDTCFCQVCNYLCIKSVVTENNIAFIDRIPHQHETYTSDIF